jgi:hypothetical protein
MRDPDEALEAAGVEAQDWEGGTRIGPALAEFNRNWSRRVLGRGAVVLLITDGLDRDEPERLEAAMERLSLSARRVIWVNPLLRWDGFAPKAAGIRAMLPHVSSFRAGHNIAALAGLAEAVARPDDPGEKARLMAGPRKGALPPLHLFRGKDRRPPRFLGKMKGRVARVWAVARLFQEEAWNG